MPGHPNLEYAGRIVAVPAAKVGWMNDREVDAVPMPSLARLAADLRQADVVQQFAAHQHPYIDFLGERSDTAGMILICMTDYTKVDRTDAFASQKRGYHESASISASAKRRPGIKHRRVPVGLQDQGKSLADIEHVKIDTFLRRRWRPVENRCKCGKQAEIAARPTGRQQRP